MSFVRRSFANWGVCLGLSLLAGGCAMVKPTRSGYLSDYSHVQPATPKEANTLHANPADAGEFRVFNQATEQFSLEEMAKVVQNSFPGQVDIEYVDNPRVELENHYYNFTHTALESLGLKPHLLSDTLLHHMFDVIERHQDRVDRDLLRPTVNWRHSHRTT